MKTILSAGDIRSESVEITFEEVKFLKWAANLNAVNNGVDLEIKN